MSKDFTARLNGDNKRVMDWLDILGSREVHIKSPIPSVANLPGNPRHLIYEMDISLLTKDQRTNLINKLAIKFNIPVDEVDRDLDKIGCPILADDITVIVQNPQKWF